MSNTSKLIFSSIVLYLISSILSYFIFTKLVFSGYGNIISGPIAEPKKDKNGMTVFNTDLPRTEVCPLNGALYSKQQRQWWEKHRPLGVMVENHVEARPQSGISMADVVYEAVAEGGITRFLAVYYCQDAEFVGPVRSARTYFLDFISEYGNYPLYAHVGGANTPGPADALGQIRDYDWNAYNDLNQFSIGFPVFAQDKDRLKSKDGGEIAIEHTMYSSPSKLWNYAAKKRDLTNVDEDDTEWNEDFKWYSFKKEAAESERGASQEISYDFWEGYSEYSVKWVYNKATNSYLRFNGERHIDKNTGKQLSAKNLIILFMSERRANDGYLNNLHMLYGTKGKGNALVFMNGKKILANWSKKDRLSRTIVTERASGLEIEFNPGMMWFSVLGIGTEVVDK